MKYIFYIKKIKILTKQNAKTIIKFQLKFLNILTKKKSENHSQVKHS